MFTFIAALGCIKAPAGDSGVSDSGAVCGSTQGFLFGTVTNDGGSPTSATVKAYPNGDEEGAIETATNADGQYELNLEGGTDWVITAWDSDECYAADTTVSVVECTEEQVDLQLDDCVTADKPNLYLYPQEPTRMTVEVELKDKQTMVASDPAYGDGWSGTAWPNGTWTEQGERFDFLFYEVSLSPRQHANLPPGPTTCAADLGQLTDIVRAYGFNEREVVDFHEAWVEDLPHAEQYAVTPMRSVDRMAQVRMDPPLRLERVWFLVEPAETCDLGLLDIEPMDRSGAHAVEWGVILDGF